MNRVLALLLLLVAGQAGAMDINGQLIKARVENLSANPTCAANAAGRIIWDTDDLEFRVCDGSNFLTLADTTSALSNPMDSDGDLIYGGTGGAATKLDHGTANYVLRAAGASAPAWALITNASIDASAAIAGSKIQAASASNTGTVSYEDSSTFGCSFTGPRSETVTIRYARVGKSVCLTIPETLAACSVATSFACATGNPSSLRPGVRIRHPLYVVDNTTDSNTPGVIDVESDGDIRIYRTNTANNFTASGSCGWYGVSVCYAIP